MDALDRAYAHCNKGLRIDALFNACRAHPLFNNLLRTINLVDQDKTTDE